MEALFQKTLDAAIIHYCFLFILLILYFFYTLDYL